MRVTRADNLWSLVRQLLAQPGILPRQPHATAIVSSGIGKPSTEESVPQQIGACGNDRNQHQLSKEFWCNSIAQMLSDIHAECDRQYRDCRDGNVEPAELAAGC